DLNLANVAADIRAHVSVLERHRNFLLLDFGQQGTTSGRIVRVLLNHITASCNDPDFFVRQGCFGGKAGTVTVPIKSISSLPRFMFGAPMNSLRNCIALERRL